MPIVDEDELGGRPLARIFLAATIAEARGVEAVLDQFGITYAVRVEPCGRTLFGSVRHGAAFVVDAGQAAYSEEALVRAGLGAGVVHDPPRADPPERGDPESDGRRS